MRQTLKQTAKYRVGFIGRKQVDLFMLICEDYIGKQIIYASPIFVIKSPQWLQKLVWRKFGWAGTV